METWPSLNIPAHSFEDFEPKVFNSYKSIVNGAHLFLESVIFKWPLDKVTPKMKKNELIFRKITAAKAIRTMKKAA